MLKPRLMKIVEEIFATGGNHDPAKDLELRGRLIDFLREEDHLILPNDDPNLILAKDMIRFLDADRVYAKTTSSKEAYPHIKPFLDRMIQSDFNNWHYDELRILISSVHFTESIDQAMELAQKAEKRISQFKRVRPTEISQGYLALNMCMRILNAKFFDSDIEICLSTKFQYWMNMLEYLVGYNKGLELALLVTKIRWNVFNRDASQIFVLCDDLAPRYDEQIGKAIRNEVDFYVEAGVFELEQIKEEFGEILGGEKQ